MRLFSHRTTEKVSTWMFFRWMDIRPRNGDTYLTRLYLLNTPWFGIKLHWFHGPDPDQDCHDHPWDFLSLVLRGVYQEKRQRFEQRGLSFYLVEESEAQRKAGTIALRRSTDVHRITMVSANCLTLVINGPKRGSWFFWEPLPTIFGEDTPTKFRTVYKPVPWRTYLGYKEDTPSV